jgi:aspartyl-tRNA(Asn)/glutamyl-tRNA(Gln) amidotransferase subunit C
MIDRQQIQKIAHLARLDITPAEEEEFAPQLNSILEYFNQLSKPAVIVQLFTVTVNPF